MRTLAASEIIRVWELGQNRPAWQRALLLLAPCFPDARPSELGSLSLSRRNALLLELRERLSGPVMHCFVLCPQCGAPLEFSVTVQELLARQVEEQFQEELIIESEGKTYPYRLPDTHDLAAASQFLELPEAAALLLRRAVSIEAGQTMSEKIEDPIEDAIERVAPLTDMRIPLRCANGEHIWAASLDIAAFLWTEVDRIATRLLDEVQALARAFGWQESEILAMSDGRRKFYLEAIPA